MNFYLMAELSVSFVSNMCMSCYLKRQRSLKYYHLDFLVTSKYTIVGIYYFHAICTR